MRIRIHFQRLFCPVEIDSIFWRIQIQNQFLSWLNEHVICWLESDGKTNSQTWIDFKPIHGSLAKRTPLLSAVAPLILPSVCKRCMNFYFSKKPLSREFLPMLKNNHYFLAQTKIFVKHSNSIKIRRIAGIKWDSFTRMNSVLEGLSIPTLWNVSLTGNWKC